MVLLLQPPDPSAHVTFWKSMQLQFPDDFEITRRAASAHMFTAYAGADIEHGVLLFQRALSLLPHAEDDSDPHTLGVLYEAAVAYYQTQNLERAETLFARFLNHAPAFGHRKVAEAHFILGLITVAKAKYGSRKATALKTKRKNARVGMETALSAAAGHLRDGVALLERVPPFLRGSTQGSPNRKILERITSLAGTPTLDTTATLPTIKKKWGGELVFGPRRHSDLRSETSTLQWMWRKSIAAMAEAYNTEGLKRIWSTQTRQSATHANTSINCANATID
ncbi:hypothetical protein PF008_g30507 [Phytophthora fragariae]|uniref:Uncharacterized protein n=1 Tax=Phytophthora fragariae TaxID=53985 RepID=A0A6G0Q607_9STRA|nr:hypothetical protein PF008_g30507 [Phytophthora fragariae]